MGLKIFDTYEDKILFPLSLKMVDTPGTLMDKPQPFIQQAFKNPSIIFIVFDMSKVLESTTVLKWTKFVLDQV